MARDAEPRMSHAARGSEMDNPPPESQPSQRITLNRAIHRDAPEVDTSGEADGRYRSAAGAGQDRVHPVAVVVPVAVATVADVQVEHLAARHRDIDRERCRRALEHRRRGQHGAVDTHAERDGPGVDGTVLNTTPV